MEKNSTYTIMIVDDNQNNLFTLRALIEAYIDAEVIEANSGDKALQELLQKNVDLIILDVQMDEMDGFELASIIKNRKKTSEIPIVFLTASRVSDEFKKRGFEVGGVDYLTKPIDDYQLINRINIYLKLIEKERNLNIELEKKVKHQMEELIRAKEEAVAANETKSMFLANMSHELRTPLNILLSTTQLMNMYLKEDGVLDKNKFQNKLNIQIQNCYRLLRLVSNLIDITKIDVGYYDLIITKCNIVEIVEAITLSVVDYVEGKGITLTFDTDTEEEIIECDMDAVERIILNLLSNAVKFTPFGGTILVSIKSLETGVRISVKDNGIGISEDKLNVIFERFKQGDDLLTRQHEGSGIGLSLVKSLVEMHHGTVYVESEYQCGSEFIIELPRTQGGDAEENGTFPTYETDENVVKKIHIEFSDIYF